MFRLISSCLVHSSKIGFSRISTTIPTTIAATDRILLIRKFSENPTKNNIHSSNIEEVAISQKNHAIDNLVDDVKKFIQQWKNDDFLDGWWEVREAGDKLNEACKLAILNYIKALEETIGNKEIVPDEFMKRLYLDFKLCHLIMKKIEKEDKDKASEFSHGRTMANLICNAIFYEDRDSLEWNDYEKDFQYVFRFLEIVKELPVNEEWANYLYEGYHQNS